MRDVPGKQRLKDALAWTLKRPLGEAALFRGRQLYPRDGFFRRLAPQPRHYRLDESRTVERWGFRLRLSPANYFQWHHFFGFSDEVLELLSSLAAECRTVLDIGANIGLYTAVMASRLPPGGRLLSVEANPETYARLLEHLRMNGLDQVEPIQVAVGDMPGSLALSDSGAGDSGKYTLREVENASDSITVEVRTVDQLVAERGLENVDLIKIDVEGFEPQVLVGARACLERDHPMVCLELTPEWCKDEGLLERALGWMPEAGYRFYVVDELGLQPIDAGSILRPASLPRRQYNLLLWHESRGAVQYGIRDP